METCHEEHRVELSPELARRGEVAGVNVDGNPKPTSALADKLSHVRVNVNCGHTVTHLCESERDVPPATAELEDVTRRTEGHRLDQMTDGQELVSNRLGALRGIGERSSNARLEVDSRPLVDRVVVLPSYKSEELEHAVAVRRGVGIVGELQSSSIANVGKSRRSSSSETRAA